MSRCHHPTMRHPETGEPIPIVHLARPDRTAPGMTLAEIAQRDFDAASPEERAAAMRRYEDAMRTQTANHSAELARLEQEARFPAAAPGEQSASTFAPATLRKAARARPKSDATSPLAEFGKQGAAHRNRQQWTERERCVQMVARLWREVETEGLRPGWKRWTAARAARAIAAKWPNHYPQRAEDTLRSYVIEAVERELVPTF